MQNQEGIIPGEPQRVPITLARAMALRGMQETERVLPILKKSSVLSNLLSNTEPIPGIIRDERIDRLEQTYDRLIPLVGKPVAGTNAITERAMEVFQNMWGDFSHELGIADLIDADNLSYDVVTAWVRHRPQSFSTTYQQFVQEYQSALALAEARGVSPAAIYENDTFYMDLIRTTFTPADYIHPFLEVPILDEKFIGDYIDYLFDHLEEFTEEQRLEIKNRYNNEGTRQRNIALQVEHAQAMVGAVIQEEVKRYWGEDGIDKLPEEAKALIKTFEEKQVANQKEAERLKKAIDNFLRTRSEGGESKSDDTSKKD